MMESQPKQARLREMVKSIRDKANLQASCHSVLADHYGRCSSFVLSMILVFSTVSLAGAFMPEDFVQRTAHLSPDALKWLKGLISMSTFLAGLLLSRWGWSEREVGHTAAVRHYSAIVNLCRQLLDAGVELQDEIVADIRAQYEQDRSLPKIPDGQFLKLKQKHLQKVLVSKALDETPFTSLKEIEQRLRAQTRGPAA